MIKGFYSIAGNNSEITSFKLIKIKILQAVFSDCSSDIGALALVEIFAYIDVFMKFHLLAFAPEIFSHELCIACRSMPLDSLSYLRYIGRSIVVTCFYYFIHLAKIH